MDINEEIESHEEHLQYLLRICHLMDVTPEGEESPELDHLVNLVLAYEEKHYKL